MIHETDVVAVYGQRDARLNCNEIAGAARPTREVFDRIRELFAWRAPATRPVARASRQRHET